MHDNTKNTNDDEMNVNTYKSVMGFSSKVGIPAAIGLTVMFASLVMANGVLISIVAGIFSAVVTYYIVKMFFSH